jgi:hypothetical protein
MTRTSRQTAPVRDTNGQALAYVYFEEELGPRSAAKLLTRDAARSDCSQHRKAAGAAAPMTVHARWLAFWGYHFSAERQGQIGPLMSHSVARDEAWRIATNITKLSELLRDG